MSGIGGVGSNTPYVPGAGGAGVSSVSLLGTSGSILPILDFPRISGGTSATGAGRHHVPAALPAHRPRPASACAVRGKDSECKP